MLSKNLIFKEKARLTIFIICHQIAGQARLPFYI
jgi:hypothetical protein